MNNFLDTLGRWIKSFLHFLNNFFNHLSGKWQEEQKYRHQYNRVVYLNYIYQMILKEFYLILKNSPYEFLNKISSSDSINSCGWEYRGDEVVYYFDIYVPDPPNNFVLEQIRKKLNIKIAQYQRQLIQQYGHEQAFLLYPCIYHGIYILSIKQDGAMVRFEIITHLSSYYP